MSDDRKKYYPEGSGAFDGEDTGRVGKVVDGDDLRPHVKATLKDYLKSITNDAKNVFPIEHLAQEDVTTKELTSFDVEASLYPNEGSPQNISTIVNQGLEAQPSYLPVDDSSSEANDFRSLSDSGQFTDIEDDKSTLRTFFDKTERGPGHNLLRSTIPADDVLTKEGPNPPGTQHFHPVPDEAPVQQKRVSQILQTNNRFSPSEESPYTREGNYSNTLGSLGSIHTTLGIHSLNTPNGDLAIQDLRKIGLELMASQAGHAGTVGSRTAVIPGPGFFSTRINKSDMNVRNTGAGKKTLSNRPILDLESLNDQVDDDSDKYSNIASKSFGNGFSHLEPFMGNSLAHATMVLQGLLGTMLSGTFVGIFLELLYGEYEDTRAQGADPASLTFGKHTDAPEATLTQFGIPFLKYPVFNAIASGMLALFGMYKKKNLPEENGFDFIGNFLFLIAWFALVLIDNIKDFIRGLSLNKGFYVVIARQAMRDNDKFNRIFSGSFWVDFLKEIAMAAFLGGSVKAILLAIVRMFTSISGFKFFMTLAVMGDKCYEGQIADFSGLHVKFDQMEDTGATRVYKSRVNDVTNALAWRHRSAPSLMYLPAGLFQAMEKLGGHPNAAIAAAAKIGDSEGTEYYRRTVIFDTLDKKNPNRISPEDVQEIENQLEGEYMPFYFQDIRTNEIISFHAFISDIKDSFSVEYNESSGFGRIDPIKIYKRTTRSISLTFYVVSTSEEDFDSMWFSINKLTQLIYPQWSMGRPVSDGTDGFIMPNSQHMTASPLIRLRVGDFIRGNSSRFNLAKLFGLQEPDSSLGDDGKPIKFKGAPKEPTLKPALATKGLDNAKAFLKTFGDFTSVGAAEGVTEAILKRSTTHAYTAKSEEEGASFLGITLTADPPLFKVWTRCDAVVTIKKTERRPGSDKKKKLLSEMDVQPFQLEVAFKDDKDLANPFKDRKDFTKKFVMYVQPQDLMPITGKSVIEAGKPSAVDEEFTFEDIAGGTSKFLGADIENGGNPIMAAARSTHGRGLAGFITSMDFDYSEATYETSSLTRRAPKMVKVSMAFAPIHDIAPGMDNLGGMRAPLYPVGDIMSHMSQEEIRNLARYGFSDKTKNQFTLYGKASGPKAAKDRSGMGIPTDARDSFYFSNVAPSKVTDGKKFGE